MPTYVYQCSACNNTFEVEQRITADPLDTCECGSTGTVKRVIQRVAVSFKGSGFHINDYAGSGSEPKVEAKAETPAEPALAPPAPVASE
ncbi:FmdB family zinc ribbon protein [Fimbriimonas ginsengisoli]|nr:FmdB family zinc ribbon protein [Fimbriimonas ginsengisoli]